MKKLSVFNFLSLNGFYKGVNEDISWHRHGDEEAAYAAEGAQTESILLFGRKTFEMMAGYWTTPQGLKDNPAVAEGMTKSQKIVISRTLNAAAWENTRIVKDNMLNEVRKLKERGDKDITVLGSGSIVTQLADAGLIDVFQFMIDPVVLSQGVSVFHGLSDTLNLQLTNSKSFSSGVVLMEYKPVKN
jgi:dihydrofolate reductase